jgi:sugar phosphate permease
MVALPTSCATDAMASHENVDDGALYRRVAARLMPLLLLCYVVSNLDRINVSFAKLEMMSALKLSDAVYGMGAGLFFVG